MYDYESLEKKLKRILSYLADGLEVEHVKDISEFIDHGEYGEAYHLLCHVIGKGNRPIPPNIYEMIVDLGKQMDLTEDVQETLGSLKKNSDNS